MLSDYPARGGRAGYAVGLDTTASTLEILRLLRTRDMTAGELAERFPLAKSTLSGHFSALKHAGLIVVAPWPLEKSPGVHRNEAAHHPGQRDEAEQETDDVVPGEQAAVG